MWEVRAKNICQARDTYIAKAKLLSLRALTNQNLLQSG